VLEELAITVQAQLGDRLPLPFCAFNGGADVFVDLGNKSLGLEVPPRSPSLERKHICASASRPSAWQTLHSMHVHGASNASSVPLEATC
jgi:IMP-specific 5'-nucleotidase